MPHRSLEAGRAATAKHYAANKEYYAERNRKRQEEFRKAIVDGKSKPCMDCGESYPHYVMDYDHRENKSFNVANRGSVSSMKKLLDEIAKCDVVCSNCHRKRTWQRSNP